MGNKIRFGFDVDDGGAVRKLNGVSQAFDKIGGKGSGASLFGNVGAKAVAAGFNLVADAASRVVDVIGLSITAALDEEASIAKLDAALKTNVKGWDGNRAAIEDVLTARLDLGFSDDEQRDSLALLVAATGDVTRALDIQRTAMDLARLKGIPLAEATAALTKVEGGQYRMLASLGIKLKDGATAQDALTAVQNVANGQADAYSDTLKGKLLISQIKINEAMEKLGAQIAPPLIAFLTVLTDEWLPAFARGWDKVSTAIGKVVAWIADMVGRLERGIAKVREFLSLVREALPGDMSLYNEGHDKLKSSFGHAAGGWVGLHGPEIGMLGERGPEYITPTHQAMGPSGASHGHDIIMDGKRVARMIDQRLATTYALSARTRGAT